MRNIKAEPFEYPSNLITDSEAQPIIAKASNNFDEQFFYTNHSGLPLDDVKAYFCSLFPSFRKQQNAEAQIFAAMTTIGQKSLSIRA